MKLEQGARYKAEISLGFFESIASNAQVQEKLNDAGFTDVTVYGVGAHRTALGTWPGATQDADIPKQITSVARL